MSLFGDIGGAINALLGAPGDIVAFAKRVFRTLAYFWSFVTGTFAAVTNAWQWMVNGVRWLGEQATSVASQTANAIWHLVTSVIPRAAHWAYAKATGELGAIVRTAKGDVEKLVKDADKIAGEGLRSVEGEVKSLERSTVKDIADAWHWVTTEGAKVAGYIEHPQRLADLLADKIALPVVKWFMGKGTGVAVWLIRSLVGESPAAAHLIEDVLAKLTGG